jgi:hypothetical protein
MADEKPNGLFVTDDAGNDYYLRPEILAQARMPEEDLKKLRAEMAAGGGKGKDGELSVEELHTVAGGMNLSHTHLAFNLPQISVAALHSPTVDFGKVMTSTVMCPW